MHGRWQYLRGPDQGRCKSLQDLHSDLELNDTVWVKQGNELWARQAQELITARRPCALKLPQHHEQEAVICLYRARNLTHFAALETTGFWQARQQASFQLIGFWIFFSAPDTVVTEFQGQQGSLCACSNLQPVKLQSIQDDKQV